MIIIATIVFLLFVSVVAAGLIIYALVARANKD